MAILPCHPEIQNKSCQVNQRGSNWGGGSATHGLLSLRGPWVLVRLVVTLRLPFRLGQRRLGPEGSRHPLPWLLFPPQHDTGNLMEWFQTSYPDSWLLVSSPWDLFDGQNVTLFRRCGFVPYIQGALLASVWLADMYYSERRSDELKLSCATVQTLKWTIKLTNNVETLTRRTLSLI